MHPDQIKLRSFKNHLRMESFFQVRQARNHVTSLEDRTRDIESQIGNIRSTISEIRQNIRHREIQIEENESNLVQTGNERFIKIIEKENYLLDQARRKLAEFERKTNVENCQIFCH